LCGGAATFIASLGGAATFITSLGGAATFITSLGGAATFITSLGGAAGNDSFLAARSFAAKSLASSTSEILNCKLASSSRE
jgi:hypothetical protein